MVQVVRDLRSKQSRAEKAEAKTGKYVAPKVSFKELKQVFRDLTDQTIRVRLRDKCECIAVKVNVIDSLFMFCSNIIRRFEGQVQVCHCQGKSYSFMFCSKIDV